MGVEIERRFLVTDTSFLREVPGIAYRQGYLSTDPDRTVRVRVAGAHAFLTIKGRTVGARRAEFEYAIPRDDADALLALCLAPIVEKMRHRVDHAGRSWEVDVFAGVNAGLVVAEVELPDVAASVELPEWAGAEVTDDPRYANAALVAHPFAEWDPAERTRPLTG